MTASNRILGPLYYALFTVFVFFILVNMFIAIISGSYQTISENAPPITVKQLKKPLLHIQGLLGVIKTRKRLFGETELLQKMGDQAAVLQNRTVTRKELETALSAANIPPLHVYVERLREVHRKRTRILHELEEEQKHATENEDSHLLRSTVELKRPDSPPGDGVSDGALEVSRRLDDIDRKLNQLVGKLGDHRGEH